MTSDTLPERLAALEAEHEDLDEAITALLAKRIHSPLQVQRLKKRKLAIKEEITRIQDKLRPDIIA